MNRNRIATAICCISLLCGCSITHRLERRQYRADVLHVSREQREREQQTYRPPVLRIERDSSRFYLVPTEVQENGERMMSMQIPQVTIRAKARTLPERLGKVTIDFVIDMPRQLQGTCRNIVITPFLHKNGEAKPLEEITFRGNLFSRVQERDYWQYDKYLRVFDPTPIAAERAFLRFVKYPYCEDVRLDSIVPHPSHISYYYSQDVPTDETSKTMLVTLQGWVMALDDSYYNLPPSDTLSYNISSMLFFVDTTTRYKIRIVDKYITVQDRNYIQYPVNDTRIIETLGDNSKQLGKISSLMTMLLEQQEFYVDSIMLTASASPEGRYSHNENLARGRARALRDYLVRNHGSGVDTLIKVRWLAEDWPELEFLIEQDSNIANRRKILELIHTEKNPDKREGAIQNLYAKDYRYIRERLYPALRAVTFRYNLRRVGMVKDTIHTREIDTSYMQGLALLQNRKYPQALYILGGYNDRNTVVAHLSMGHDQQALEILDKMEKTAVTEYLKAIAYSRLGRKTEGREHFLAACEMDEKMQYRGNLDPEITELLKH